MQNEEIIKLVNDLPGNEFFKSQSHEWKNASVEIIKQQVHFLTDFPKMIHEMITNDHLEMTDTLLDILNWETTPKIISFLHEEVSKWNTPFITEGQLNIWMEQVKKELGVKGKPLFMGVRAALTGRDHGPELKFLIPLTPVNVIKKRLDQLKK
jgi:glutamyl/glutaminyl-tRNA synthetase